MTIFGIRFAGHNCGTAQLLRHKYSMLKPTYDLELKTNNDYLKVMSVMEQLDVTGTLERAYGYCLGISDMIYTLLKQQGIASRLVECKLTVTSQNPPFLHVIGADDPRNKQYGLTDTHVVVVTETDIPMIIDASIGAITKGFQPYIVERVNGQDMDTIADHQIDHVRWTYSTKINTRLPKQHELSIIDRIKTDRTVINNITLLKTLVVIALLLSALNAVRGAYDFYQVYINEANYWGPKHIKDLHDKIEHLEELVRKPINER